jgi:hypothetical protein
MEANIDFAARKDRPTIIQPLKAGDQLMMKLFLFC